MYSRAKILGHPIHPMLVGFPIAFYTATFVALIIYGAAGGAFWFRAALWANLAGVVMAIVAAVPGFIDWALGVPAKTRAKTVGRIHLGANLGALALFIINLIVQFGRWQAGEPAATALGIVLTGFGLALTVAAGALGWTLVQTHHVGIQPLSEAEKVRARAEMEQAARGQGYPSDVTPLRPVQGDEHRPGGNHPAPPQH